VKLLFFMISLFREDGLPLVRDVEWGSGFRRRACGLIGAESLSTDRGLVLVPCRAIHTWFMRFSLDIVFFARDGRVVRIVTGVKPFRFVWGGRAAWGVMEMQAGWFHRARLEEGDQLVFKNSFPYAANSIE
jgi:uncharacterized protein